MTALDWFFTQVLTSLHSTMSREDIDRIVGEAKQMEKDQILQAWNNGHTLGRYNFLYFQYPSPEKYYQETYQTK